jgi:NAD(P)-dependent dehydrogenase (short-subunit alcohol dehydrogenase family)
MSQSQSILVTGGSYGIGRAVAVKFADEGYHVVLLARNESGLRDTEQKILDTGGTCTVVSADLSDFDLIGEKLRDVVSEHGKFDALWSGAFGYVEGPISDLDIGEVSQLFNGGVIGAINVVKCFLANSKPNPLMYLVAADWGFPDNEGLASFISAKKAIDGLGTALQKELHGKARVSIICPADVSSHSHDFDAEPEVVLEDTAGAAIATIELANLCYSFSTYKTLFVPRIVIHPISQKFSVTFAS